MNKKIISLFIAICIAIQCCFAYVNQSALAGVTVPIDTNKVGAALLMEAGSGKILFEYEADEKRESAGLSRLPALLVICEAFDEGILKEDTMVTVGDKAAAIKGTTAFLKSGEQMNAGDMLMAAVMINAGDAIHALACAAFGSENTAAEKINSRMNEIGVSVQYADICGEGSLLSASELAKIGMELLKSETYGKNGTLFYEKIEHNTGAGETELANPNKLIKQYSGCMGIATGSSKESGYCGVFAADRGGTAYIAVVLGAANGADRFGTGIELLDYGFASFRSVTVIRAGEVIAEIPVVGGLENTVKAISTDDAVMLLNVSDAKYFSENVLPETINAPVSKGQSLGSVKLMNVTGDLIFEIPLVADRDIVQARLIDYIELVVMQWLRRDAAD